MPGFAPGIHGLLLWRKDLNQRSRINRFGPNYCLPVDCRYAHRNPRVIQKRYKL
jgi:hypothetical protein